MGKHWLLRLRKKLMIGCAAWAFATGPTGLLHAQDVTTPSTSAALQAQLQAQQREIDELKRMVQANSAQQSAGKQTVNPQDGSVNTTAAVQTAQPLPTGALPGQLSGPNVDGQVVAVPKAIGGTGTAFGYDVARGFYFDANYDPGFSLVNPGALPFELRIRGRIQTDYYGYDVRDDFNHLTGVEGKARDAANQSELMVKRMRLIFAGFAFDENLRYQIQFDGNSRGLAGEDTRTNSFNNPIGNVEGGQNITNVDGGVRLLEAWIAYDFHGAADCNNYRPVFTLIAGKLKPMGSYEEYLGSGNCQFVEFAMSSWMFDSDADNYAEGWGFQYHGMEDKLFLMGLITSGSDNQVPTYQLQDLPGFQLGGWYDFGGTWDEQKKRWKPFGETVADIEQHEDPMLRVGGNATAIPMDRRSQYTQAEMDFYKAASAAPGGSNVDSILNGGGLGGAAGQSFTGVQAGTSPFGVDAFNAYTFDFFANFKYQGFSVYNEWWLRDLNDFRGTPNTQFGGNYPILYTTNNSAGATGVAAFVKSSLIDFGTTLQAGYFIVPHRFELAARWAMISGESGDINGNGTFTTVSATALGIKESGLVGGAQPANTLPLGTTVRVVNGAFTHDNVSQEIAFGVNVYFYGERVKWQSDISYYSGGNPATNGQAAAGYINGVDGFLFRTQIQFAF